MFRLSAVRNAVSLIRLQPFDVTTPDGRSKERLRRGALTALAAGLCQAISLMTPLVTIKISLSYLGAERYGLWMTLTSLVGMLGFCELGLGNGLVTCICRARGREDLNLIRKAVTGTLGVLLAFAAVLVLCAVITWPLVPWARVLNATTPQASKDAEAAVAICLLIFIIALPLGLVQRVQAGFQEEYRSQLWQVAARIAGMMVIVLLAKAHVSFPIFLLAAGLVSPLVLFLNGLVYFGWQRPSVRPRLQEWDSATARLMLRMGQWFLVLAVIRLAAAQVDNLIVAQVQGLASVPAYSIPSRVFEILLAVGGMIYQPMWAANGEALARGEVGWVRRNTARISLLGSGLMLAAGSAFIVLAGPLFRVWLGRVFEPNYPLMTGFTLWAALLCFAGPYFMVLNGANVVRPQVYVFGVFAVVSISLKYVGARFFGPWAIPWAALIPYVVIVLPFALRESKKILSNRSSGSGQDKVLTRDASPPAGVL